MDKTNFLPGTLDDITFVVIFTQYEVFATNKPIPYGKIMVLNI